MTLSDVKGERVFDVIADIIDPITSIALDKEAKKFFERKPAPEGVEPWDFFLQQLRDSLPTLIKSHKHDICKIIATIKGVSVKKYVSEMTLPSLLADLTGLLTDQEFRSFFV